MPDPKRTSIFVSYSHKDATALEEFKTMLAPVLRGKPLDLWDDSKIRPADNWREEIAEAMERAVIAVLLVSPAFLASRFITETEVPRLLAKARAGGLRVCWIYLEDCLYEETPIGQYQAANDPRKPLKTLTEAARSNELKSIVKGLLDMVEAESAGGPASGSAGSTPGAPERTSDGAGSSSRVNQVLPTSQSKDTTVAILPSESDGPPGPHTPKDEGPWRVWIAAVLLPALFCLVWWFLTPTKTEVVRYAIGTINTNETNWIAYPYPLTVRAEKWPITLASVKVDTTVSLTNGYPWLRFTAKPSSNGLYLEFQPIPVPEQLVFQTHCALTNALFIDAARFVHAIPFTNGPIRRASVTVTNDVTLTKLRPDFSLSHWTNTLGMVFVPVPMGRSNLLFSIWETRVQDFEPFLQSTKWQGIGDWHTNSGTVTWWSPNNPASYVSWVEAESYCVWLTDNERRMGVLPRDVEYRLPRDTEWSAAVGMGETDQGDYPKQRHDNCIALTNVMVKFPCWELHGNDTNVPTEHNGKANYGQWDNYRYPAPVGSFASNRFGIFDLGGNVAEWCEDLMDPNRTTNTYDGLRVTRGQGYQEDRLQRLRSGYREPCKPEQRHPAIGFRCVLAPR